MGPNIWIILTILVPVITLIIGLIIGFYKTKSDMSDVFISKEDCSMCIVKNEVAHLVTQMTNACKKLEDGSKKFEDLLVAQTKLQTQMESLLMDKT